MKGFLALAAVLTIFGLLVAVASPGTTAQADNVCPANPSPPDEADPSMVISTPASGANVTSPVTIAGKARVFEATVSIKIYGASGNVLADAVTQASEAGPTLAPYSAHVSFTVAKKQQGCIRVYEASAKDGSPINVVQVKVTLAPPTTPPDTGSAGLQSSNSDDNHIGLYAAGTLAILGAVALALHRRLWV